MAHSLNLEVIAEGVETENQLAFVREHGCDAVQGYFFSPALPGEEIKEFIKKGAGIVVRGSPFEKPRGEVICHR